MPYISDLMNGLINPRNDRISLERFIIENSYITKYLSRLVKDKALVIYHVLFQMSYFNNGSGVIVVPWAKVGSYIMSEQGNIIDNNTTVKRRLGDLIRLKCISIRKQRGGANEITVHLPSEIPTCKEMIEKEEEKVEEQEEIESQDFYTDQERRLVILERDHRKCSYCLLDINEDIYVLDHLIPSIKGGTNYKNNLVASCGPCNERKMDQDPIDFLLQNYRMQLLKQDEYVMQKGKIEKLLQKQKSENAS